MNEIFEAIEAVGGFGLVVGGYVRDRLLGVESKDIDIEVYGIDVDTLVGVLNRFGKVDAVGRSFGVIKLTTQKDDFDFSLPRRENKVGRGHKDFRVKPDPNMTPKEAASRRDFTWNSLAMTRTGEIKDFFGGRNDLELGLLRHTSEKFGEDPLRVLRGMQFAGRFGFRVVPETAELCRQLRAEYSDLSTERVWGEFWKLCTKSTRPSAGLEFLRETGWVELFPELNSIIGCQQEPEWHPEGDVWQHTCHAADVAAEIAIRENLSPERKGIVVLAAICHDLGKPDVTDVKNGRIVSPGHNDVKRTMSFLTSIGAPRKVVEEVAVLVKEHMIHVNPITHRGVRRLLNRLGGKTDLDTLLWVIEADHSGRPPLQKGMPEAAQQLKDTSAEIGGVESVQPILLGRHLIDRGISPGPEMGKMLKEAFQAQLDGEFNTVEGGLNYLKL